MKATLEFKLPKETYEHKCALSGMDSLLLINDLENEIRSKIRYNSGEFKEFIAEEWDDDRDEYVKKSREGDDSTLEKVLDWITSNKIQRNLPEII